MTGKMVNQIDLELLLSMRTITHSDNTLSADKLEIKGNNILSVENQLLLVTNEVNIEAGAEIRLIGTSQLIQTHEDTSKVTGDGNIYIDQNSDIESVYQI